jgi:hypothetical protein
MPEFTDGTWSEEMGHGVVNAHAAVLAALETRCPNNLPVVHGTINQNTTWNTPLHAIADIVVPNSITLTINHQVKFDYEASIIVESGGTLIIDGGTLTNACEDEMWQGITVLGDPNKPLDQRVQAYVNITNGGKIENAHCGILVKDGGIVRATDAFFVNNTTGIKFESIARGQSGRSGAFTRTNFVLNNQYLGNTADFEAHIKMENSGSVVVTGCIFSSTAPQNSAVNNNGITAFNSALSVSADCIPHAYSPPCNTNPSTFTGFNNAISAANSGTTPVVSVTGSTFKRNMHGIKLNAANYAKLFVNNFEVTRDFAVGAYLSNATGYKIEENKFWAPPSAFPPPITVGLTINNSGTVENEVYKNTFDGLYTGQNFLCENSAQNGVTLSGLQTLCNTFTYSQYRDILVGGALSPQSCLFSDLSIRRDQGSSRLPAGNKFSQNFANAFHFESGSQYLINYHHNTDPIEDPNVTANSITKIPTANQNKCLSRFGDIIIIGVDDLGKALSQYDEWNEQYEYWLDKLLATNEDNEEYHYFFNMVSYYSTLKDNYFNSIIVAVMNEKEEAEGGKQNAKSDLYETLRYLFDYRGHYIDYLSITETFLTENNYEKALQTIAKMYKQFEITEEQRFELRGLETYVYWLQQLEKEGNSIYTLSELEIKYLTGFVESNTGRGKVFANNILCVLYGICIEEEFYDEIIRGLDDEMMKESDDEINPHQSVTSACLKTALQNITLVPNPTTGELRITNYELEITDIEIFDVYGRKLKAENRRQNVFDISHLQSGIYFVRITTETGAVVKKVVKQ